MIKLKSKRLVPTGPTRQNPRLSLPKPDPGLDKPLSTSRTVGLTLPVR